MIVPGNPKFISMVKAGTGLKKPSVIFHIPNCYCQLNLSRIHKLFSFLSDLKMDELPLCKYGNQCYRKNPEHLEKFRHPKSTISPPFKKRKTSDTIQPSPQAKVNVEKNGASNNEVKENGNKELETNNIETNVKDPDIPKDDAKLKDNEDENENAELNKTIIDDDTDHSISIKNKFLVQMPDEFYKFWEFCKTIKPEKPECK